MRVLPAFGLLDGADDEQGAIIGALPAFGLHEDGYDEQGAIIWVLPRFALLFFRVLPAFGLLEDGYDEQGALKNPAPCLRRPVSPLPPRLGH